MFWIQPNSQKHERRCGTQQGFRQTQEHGAAEVCSYSDYALAIPLFFTVETEEQSVAAANQSFPFSVPRRLYTLDNQTGRKEQNPWTRPCQGGAPRLE